ncbi:leucine zipper domain-containing protein [Actinacidiphila oryziradicis]|uniref:DNA-binding domain-containing protein n=1 Tax=Actinacidiphila oryziradicis TaxID=2571141 RepID=A0A4U0REK6_9ACTN|nr:leucine zipper domain-containing protein [Actinacidiphila oryziradicis]TJZ93557.1 hypothetical protein FCI23_54500 [Actinacidiphila oryziradicis]
MYNLPAVREQGSPNRYRPLAAKWQDLLRTGQGQYGSRSEAVFAFTMHVIGRGWDWTRWYGEISDESNKLGDVYRFRGGKAGHRSIADPVKAARADWDRAVRKFQASPPVQGKDDARALLVPIRVHLSHSVVSRTDRHVLEYLHSEGQRRGRILLSASVRDIALGAAVHRDTACRSVNRLTKQGWLSKHEDRLQVRDAQVYKLLAPGVRECTECTEEVCTGVDTVPSLRDGRSTGREVSVDSRAQNRAQPALDVATTDAFLKLGRAAAAVYAVLGDEALTVDQVVTKAGVAKRTAYKWLASLRDQGMAIETDRTWTRGYRDLGKVAADIGATGKGFKRRTHIRDQRRAWDDKADRVQFNVDKERYGRRTAVERAVETARARRALEAAEGPVESVDGGIVVNLLTGEVMEPQEATPEVTDVEVEETPLWWREGRWPTVSEEAELALTA